PPPACFPPPPFLSPAPPSPPCGFFGALSCFSGLGVPASDIEDLSRLLGEPHHATVAQHLESDPRGFARLRIDMRNLGQMHGRLFRDDAALRASCLLLMALHDVDTRDEHALITSIDAQDLAAFALVAARGD